MRFLVRPTLKLFPRRPCGDDPMLWKELFVSRSGALARWIGLFIGLGALFGLVYGSSYLGFPAFDEVRTYGYGVGAVSSARNNFHMFIQFVSTLIFALAGLGVAASAAGGFTSEREGDTWLSLISTELTGLEIVRAKIVGAIMSARKLILINFLLWIVGAVVGALHPFGFILGIFETAVFLWSAAAIGTLASIRSKSTTRALVITIALLVFINGGYMFGCVFMPDTSVLIAVGCSPFAFGTSLLSYTDVYDIFGFSRDAEMYHYSPFHGDHGGEFIAFVILATAFHFVLAAFATGLSFALFESAADRPRRDLLVPSRPRSAPKPEPTEVEPTLLPDA